MVRGGAWVVPDSGDTIRLRPGDVAIIRGPDPYVIADDPATPPQVVIHPGQHCTTLDGADLTQAMDLGVRTWGNSPDGSAMMLTGTYQMRSEISRRLLAALPALLVMPEDAWDCPLLALLGDEIVKDQPGQEAVLDRLLDLLLIAVLRAWFARPEAQAPAWYRAQSDPVVGRALRMLHNNPAHPWTVATLAAGTGVRGGGAGWRADWKPRMTRQQLAGLASPAETGVAVTSMTRGWCYLRHLERGIRWLRDPTVRVGGSIAVCLSTPPNTATAHRVPT